MYRKNEELETERSSHLQQQSQLQQRLQQLELQLHEQSEALQAEKQRAAILQVLSQSCRFLPRVKQVAIIRVVLSIHLYYLFIFIAIDVLWKKKVSMFSTICVFQEQSSRGGEVSPSQSIISDSLSASFWHSVRIYHALYMSFLHCLS